MTDISSSTLSTAATTGRGYPSMVGTWPTMLPAVTSTWPASGGLPYDENEAYSFCLEAANKLKCYENCIPVYRCSCGLELTYR